MGNTGLHTAPGASGSRKKHKRLRKKKSRSPSPVLGTDGKDVAGGEVSTPKKRQKQKRSASPVNEACHAAAPSADRGPAVCGRDLNSGLVCVDRPVNEACHAAAPSAFEECECVPLPHGCTEVNSGVECVPPPADCATEANPVEECVPLLHGCTEVNSEVACIPPPADCDTEANPVDECAPLPHGCTEVNSGVECVPPSADCDTEANPVEAPTEGITEISAPKKKGKRWQQRRRAPEKCLTREHQELKIQSSPAAADLSKIAHDNGE